MPKWFVIFKHSQTTACFECPVSCMKYILMAGLLCLFKFTVFIKESVHFNVYRYVYTRSWDGRPDPTRPLSPNHMTKRWHRDCIFDWVLFHFIGWLFLAARNFASNVTQFANSYFILTHHVCQKIHSRKNSFIPMGPSFNLKLITFIAIYTATCCSGSILNRL